MGNFYFIHFVAAPLIAMGVSMFVIAILNTISCLVAKSVARQKKNFNKNKED
jgi:hypothetical protein